MLTKKLLPLAICIFVLIAALATLAACGGADGGGADGNGLPSGAAANDEAQLRQPAADTEAGGAGGAAAEQTPGALSQTPPDGAQQAGATAPPLSFEADMGIAIGGEWFPIWQDAAGLLQALGDGFELYSAPSCVFDEGDDKEFAYDGIYVYTNPVSNRDMWYCVFIDSEAYPTARGISVGSAIDDVYAAYGDGCYWEGETILTYSISGVQGDISSPFIQFTVAGQLVTAIEINYPTNTT